MPRRIPTYTHPRMRMLTRVHGRTRDISKDYDAAWKKLRLAFLNEYPLCQCDECQEGKLRLTRAQVVDHIKPIAERPDLRLVWANLRSMSKRCHDRHTARTENAKRRNGVL